MDVLSTISLALGSAWASGFRLYGCVATLGLLGKYGHVQLPGTLGILTDPWIIGIASVLFVVEFFADKIPWLDSGWDAVHTFIRIPAGAILAWSAFSQTDPRLQVVAALLGGGVALSAHGTKATLRATANASPEPVSNWILSLAEDFGAGAVTFLAVFVPVVAIMAVIAAFVASIFIFKRLLKSVRSLFAPSQAKRA